MKQITTEQFDEAIKVPYAVVKYGAEWCNACVEVQPKLEEVAKKTEVPFYSVDVDESPELKERARIKAVPMTVFYRDGRPSQFIYGDTTVENIEKKLNMLTY
jgi:thioredoxin 1